VQTWHDYRNALLTAFFVPKKSTENRQYYKARIRSVIAQHPQITQRDLKQRLCAGAAVYTLICTQPPAGAFSANICNVRGLVCADRASGAKKVRKATPRLKISCMREFVIRWLSFSL
jgi:hypothetical protein